MKENFNEKQTIKEEISDIFKEAQENNSATGNKKPDLDYYDKRRDEDGQYEGKYGKENKKD